MVECRPPRRLHRPPKAQNGPVVDRLVAYARSPRRQGTNPQLDELRPVGRATILLLARSAEFMLRRVRARGTAVRVLRRGGITEAGNGQARRALIEGAWTYRMQARVSRKLHDRIEDLPQRLRDTAWKAQVRLCGRYRRLVAKGKPRVVVTTAIARETIGFIWAIARQVQLQTP